LKTGVGTETLTGANTYAGSTMIAGGTLSVSSLADGGVASGIGKAANAASNLMLSGGGTLQYTGSGASTDRLFTIDIGGGAIDASGSGAVAFTNGGSLGFVSVGTHTLTLTGANTGANTLAAVIDDGGGATSLVKSGAGTWVLTGANTFSGNTTVTTARCRLPAVGSTTPRPLLTLEIHMEPPRSLSTAAARSRATAVSSDIPPAAMAP